MLNMIRGGMGWACGLVGCADHAVTWLCGLGLLELEGLSCSTLCDIKTWNFGIKSFPQHAVYGRAEFEVEDMLHQVA